MRKSINLKSGKWEVECIPEDGGRISKLLYNNKNLLTTSPESFRPPEKDYGEYEKRPVYGYDDCFPSVSECVHPVLNYPIRDHGDLCWLAWEVTAESNKLTGYAHCNKMEAYFSRILEFNEDELIWKYSIQNKSNQPQAFLHVVHPLMPLNDIKSISLPGYKTANEVTESNSVLSRDSSNLSQYLTSIPEGKFQMLFLNEISKGEVHLTFSGGMKIKMLFDHLLFPTLGIWWNNSGYPVEKGLERNECAFEPVPAKNSNLEDAYLDGRYLQTNAGNVFEWEMVWRIITN